MSLEREPSQRFDLPVLDAFSSDAIPVHLLTKEAVALYLRHLRGPDSVLAFHISNRNLDLRPVVAGLCKEYGLAAIYIPDSFSLWMLASKNPEMLKVPDSAKRGKPVFLTKEPPLWTDDYSNLYDLLYDILYDRLLKLLRSDLTKR